MWRNRKMINAKIISERIATARKASGITQSDLARKINMSPQNVSKWERGESLPDAVTLKAIADTLNKDIAYFYGETDCNNDTCATCSPDTKTATKPRATLNNCAAKWKNLDLSHSKMDCYDFKYARFEDCDFTSADFNKNKLPYTEFVRCNLSQTDFADCDIFRADFKNCDVIETAFDNAELDQSDFTDCNLKDMSFKNMPFTSSCRACLIENVTFENIDFKSAIFKKSVFSNCVFTNCTFVDCDFRHTTFKACNADKISYGFLSISKADIKDFKIS